jgi:transposase-like protein
MLIAPSRSSSESRYSNRSLSRPNCPRCGSALLVAEESRFSSSGRIDHDWLCDQCGNAFVTSIKLGRVPARAG